MKPKKIAAFQFSASDIRALAKVVEGWDDEELFDFEVTKTSVFCAGTVKVESDCESMAKKKPVKKVIRTLVFSLRDDD